MQRALIIFARAPRRGTVKTRLAALLGDDEALRIYRDLGSRAVAATAGGEWKQVVAFTPDDAEAEVRSWLGGSIRYVKQGTGDLGDRLARCIRNSFADDAERVVVIGTDCPELTSRDIDSGFAALDEVDVVLGPATDGGYYLIGVHGDHPSLFTDMAWSAPNTLDLTVQRAADAGLRVRLLSPRSDIDTVEDLRAWQAGPEGPRAPAAGA